MDERDGTPVEPESPQTEPSTPKAYRARVEIGSLGRFGTKNAVPIRTPSEPDVMRPIASIDDDWLAPNFFDDADDDDEIDAPTRFWTTRRIFYLLLAILIVVTLVAEMLSGFFQPPEPPPTLPPMPMI